MSYSWPLSSSSKEEGEMNRRKGEVTVVVGTCRQEVAGNRKLDLVPEQARRLVEEVAGSCRAGVVVETCEPVAGVVEICTGEGEVVVVDISLVGEEMCSNNCLQRLLMASS